MARFFADENFPLPVVDELRLLGHDVLTIQDAGMANQRIDDKSILKFAAEQNRALLTINRKHFIKLDKEFNTHNGVIACTIDLDFERQAKRIHEAVEAEISIKAKLIRINRPN